jgi:CheY-like chemotaxis protein
MTTTSERHVLVVDDDADIRETLADILAVAGFVVTLAANGREALDRLHEAAFDLVVLDLMMPVMTGWEFREEQLRDPAVADVPVIVVSAARSPKPLPAAAFLPKPFDLDAILTLVERLAPPRQATPSS